jgi:hypothetical protein
MERKNKKFQKNKKRDPSIPSPLVSAKITKKGRVEFWP